MAELPGEMLLKVFKFLPSRELFLSTGVCSAWRGILSGDEEFWHGKVLKDRRPALLHHLGANQGDEMQDGLSLREHFLYHGLSVGWRNRRIATSRKLYSTGRGHQCVWEYSNHPGVLLQPPWILITPFMANADRTCALLLVNMNERPFHVTIREHLGQPPPTDQPLSRLDQYQFDRQAPLRHFTNSHTRGRAAESLGGQPSSETVTAFQFPLVAQARDSWDSWASRGSCADVWHFGRRHPIGEVEMDGKIVAMAFEANPNYDVSFSTLPPSGVLLAACTANREIRVWRITGGLGSTSITLVWDLKTDNDGNDDGKPRLALPESELTALAIWSTDRMTSRKRSRFSVAVGHVSAGITVLQMEQYAAFSGPLATPKAGRGFSVYLHGDLRWRVSAIQRIQTGGPVQQLHISFDREFTQRQPEPAVQPDLDAKQAGSSAILNAGWVLGPLDARSEAHNLPRADTSSYLAADSHYQMGLVTMHVLVRPGPKATHESPIATTTQGGPHDQGKQAVSDALSRLKMGHRKTASHHPPNSGAKQRRVHEDDKPTCATSAATPAVFPAEPHSDGDSTRPKAGAASCTGANTQSVLADDNSTGGGHLEATNLVPDSSTAAAQEAASMPCEAGFEPRSEEVGHEAAASSMEGDVNGDSGADCKETRDGEVERDCQAGCRRPAAEPCARSSSIWCLQLWPGGLPPSSADTEGGPGKGGFQLRWSRSVPNASSLSVGEGLTAVASSDGSLLLLECSTGRLVRRVPNVEVDHHAQKKGRAPKLGQPSIAACSAWVGSLGGASRGAHLLSLTELAYSQGGHYQYELSAILHSPSNATGQVQCSCGKPAVLRSHQPVKLAHAGAEGPEEVARSFYCCANYASRRTVDVRQSSCGFNEYMS